MTYVVVSSGHLRGLGATPPNPNTVLSSVLAAADTALDRLNTQRLRLAAEASALRLGNRLDVLGVGETQARINGTEALIAAIDNFVRDVYIRVEAQAKDSKRPIEERVTIANRLLTATTNILKAAGDTSPFSDLSEDIKEAVNGMMKRTKDLVTPSSWDVPLWAYGLGALAALYMISNLGRR